jgi:hypothetical protein
MPVHRTSNVVRPARFLRLPHAYVCLLPDPVTRTPKRLTGRNIAADLAIVDRLCKAIYGRSCQSVGLDARVLARMIAADKDGFTPGRLAHALAPLMRRPRIPSG